jgi:hypothetical protein
VTTKCETLPDAVVVRVSEALMFPVSNPVVVSVPVRTVSATVLVIEDGGR